MTQQIEHDDEQRATRRWPWSVGEVVLIVAIYFIYAGWPTPDVNEAHYLAKAKHYWNPSWCEGDFFLESADAHSVFYWSFGWLTLFFPLPAVAWVGRILTWTLLAVAWRRLSFAIVPRHGFAFLSASIGLCLMHRCHMAGEWMVGGVEAKGFAFVCVLFGLGSLLRERWTSSWLWMGLGAAFHVLVGGWAMVALGFAWLLAGKRRSSPKRTTLAVLGAVALASMSLVPALRLSFGTDAETIALANDIYVNERLPHHLLFYHILYFMDQPYVYVARFAALSIVWLAVWWTLRKDEAHALLQRFVAGAAIIACFGVVVDQSTLYYSELAAALLRYYWFRLADIMVPVGVSSGIATLIARGLASRKQWAVPALVMVFIGVSASLYPHHAARSKDFRPLSTVQQRPLRDQDPAAVRQQYVDWVLACRWIAEHTPRDAMFLTPRYQQTFHWYAHRAEVVGWKNVPQDAASLVTWKERFDDVYTHKLRRQGMGSFETDEVIDLCREYDVDYIVVDRTISSKRLLLKRVYPSTDLVTSLYEVYEVPR